MLIKIFLTSAAVPAALAFLVNLAVGFLPDGFKPKLQAMFIAILFCLGFYFLLGTPVYPPQGGVASLPWVALLCGLFVVLSPEGLGARYLLRAFFVAGILGVLLWTIWDSIRTNPMGYRNVAAFFCLALGVWSIVEKATEKVQKPSLILLPMLALVASSLLFVLEGSASLSQVSTTMAVILGGQLVLGTFFARRISNTALLPFLSVFIVATLVVGHFFVNINPWRAIMMCWPFFVLWIRGAIPFLPKKPIPEAIALAILAILPLIYWLEKIYKQAGGLY